jgi:hypothetical protein
MCQTAIREVKKPDGPFGEFARFLVEQKSA